MNLKGLLPQDVDAVKLFIAESVAHEGFGARGAVLVECSLGRIAANRIREEYPKPCEGGWHSPFPRLADHRHIIDWINSSLAENAAWLSNVDAQDRPKKLMKCGTYEDLIREADKAMARKNAQQARALGPEDEQHIASLARGFNLVRLLTPAALDLESRRMHHCVGHGSYDEGVANGSIEILSLRDPNGRPVVTIELTVDTFYLDDNNALSEESRTYRDISQIEGKHNDDPDSAHMAILKPFARQAGWTSREYHWPSVTDVDGVEHDVDAIPVGTVLKEIDLSQHVFENITLSEGLTVRGDVRADSFSVLPEGMKIGGDLIVILGYRNFAAPPEPLVLPESLQVDGKIRVSDENSVIVPDRLRQKVEIRNPFSRSFVGGQFQIPRRQVFARFDGVEGMQTLGGIEGFEFTPAREHHIDPRVEGSSPDPERIRALCDRWINGGLGETWDPIPQEDNDLKDAPKP